MVRKSEEKNILNLLNHDGAAYRGKGIATCIKLRLNTPLISDALRKLKNDSVMVLGRPISNYAIAALDIIGAEKYAGNDDVKALIAGLDIAFR